MDVLQLESSKESWEQKRSTLEKVRLKKGGGGIYVSVIVHAFSFFSRVANKATF